MQLKFCRNSMPPSRNNIVASREYSLVLTFLEEARMHGIEYAERRILQRLGMGWFQVNIIAVAAGEIDRRVERKFSFYHWWYRIVIGLGLVALPSYLSIIVDNRYPTTCRMAFCFIFPAIIIFIQVYAGYLRGINEKRRLFRAEMEAFGGVISRETGKSELVRQDRPPEKDI